MIAFSEIEKIDAHTHYNSSGLALLEQAEADNFSFISINTEAPGLPSISEQAKTILDHASPRLSSIATFEIANWQSPEWVDVAIAQIKKGVENGAIAIKIWKSVGMELKDKNGQFVMLDHPRFQPLLDYLVAHNIPLLAHLGEPKNCWLPLDQMTVDTDRAYFEAHPEYHMFLHPACPSYSKQMEARDHVLMKNPALIFIGAHLASLEWSTDQLAQWLDSFPNAAVDLAERICHLQLQAKDNWQKVRDFVIKYQDRILYGTDIIYDESSEPAEITERIHRIWTEDWRFFTSSDLMLAPQFAGQFRGLELPDQVVRKIYRENALRWYTRLGA